MFRRQFVRIGYRNLGVFDKQINNMLSGLASSKGVVDLQPTFFRFKLATTTALIFGEPVSGLAVRIMILSQTHSTTEP